MGIYEDIASWGTKTNPLSRSTKFDSKEHYEDFIEYVKQWGSEGKNYDKSVQQVKEDYKQSIIEALNRTLINKNIPTENGEIPKEIIEKIDNMYCVDNDALSFLACCETSLVHSVIDV